MKRVKGGSNLRRASSLTLKLHGLAHAPFSTILADTESRSDITVFHVPTKAKGPRSDFVTPEQYQPTEPLVQDGVPVVCEACQTTNGSWGYDRDNDKL